ncbi:tail fiber protein [Hafnia phage yong3]|nr:tail fiber protein [Hafnia phage yong3]
MPTRLSGVLVDAVNKPLANTDVVLLARGNTITVLAGTEAIFKTDNNGSYNVVVNAGYYDVWIQAPAVIGNMEPYQLGSIAIYADSPGGSLNSYLVDFKPEDTTPESITVVKELLAHAQSAASGAAAAMGDARAYRDEAKGFKDEAKASSTAAKTSETNSKTSETEAKKAQQGASGSANTASQAVTTIQGLKGEIEITSSQTLSAMNQLKTDTTGLKDAAAASAKTASDKATIATTGANTATEKATAAAASAVTAKNEADRAAITAAGSLKKDQNLSDLNNKDTARTNIGVDRLNQYTGATSILSANKVYELTINNDGSWGVWRSGTNEKAALDIKGGGTGANTVQSARNNLGLGDGNSPTFANINLKNVSDTAAASGILYTSLYSQSGEERALSRIYAEIRSDNKTYLTFQIRGGDASKYLGYSQDGDLIGVRGMKCTWVSVDTTGEGATFTNTAANQSNYIIGKDYAGNSIWYVGKGSGGNSNVQLRNYISNTSIGVLENGNVELITKDSVGITNVTCSAINFWNASTNRNWLMQQQGSPTLNTYNRFWGNANRACVLEWGFASNDWVGYFQRNTNASILFAVNGSISCVSLTQTSDRELKDHVKVIDDALDKIERLNGYTFTWKDSGLPSAGVIAQEVMEVLPEVISTVRSEAGSSTIDNEGNSPDFEMGSEGDRHYAVEYSGLVGLLIAGVKEEIHKRKAAEAEIDKLNKRLTTLEQAVQKLMGIETLPTDPDYLP